MSDEPGSAATVLNLSATKDEWQRARDLILLVGWNSTAYQILNPGIDLWFGRDDFAVVGYVERAGIRVVAGAPVCVAERLQEAVQAFESDARKAGVQVCWFGAEARLEETMRPRGDRALVNLGAQPVWDPQQWQAQTGRLASLRAQLNRSRNKGVTVSEWGSERGANEPELRASLNEWLAQRGLPPLHFLVETNTLDRLADRRLFVSVRAGRITGFVVASPVPARRGWLLEQVVRRPDAPNGTAELMIDFAVNALAEDGANYLTLGLVPLSRRARKPAGANLGGLADQEPWWLRALMFWARAHGHRFYNFEGLEYFKNKFGPPHWEPIYAIMPGSRASVRAIYAIAAAFSDGPPLTMLARALVTAANREMHGLADRLRSRA